MSTGTVAANGVEICYESIGDPADPPMVLIMGLGSQLTSWDIGFCELLAGRGFRVIRFDNRDAGLSTKSQGPPPKLVFGSHKLRLDGPPAYTLGDMADDTVGLMDSLGIERAHIVGASLGGMIAQHVAMSYPDRTRSLTVIMSTTGDSRVGAPTPEAAATLQGGPPPGREAYIEGAVASLRAIGGPLFDAERARAGAAARYDRSYWPQGSLFQLAASVADGNRTERLAAISCPTLVIHGRVDPLIHVSGGEAVAAAIPGARLLVLDEMGHDLPPPLWGQVVDAMTELATRS